MVMENYLPPPVRRAGTVLTLLCAGVLCGCGGGPAVKLPDPAQQATISGKVTLDGTKPAPLNSSVVFSCTDKGAIVSGTVNAAGSYTIQAADKSIGIPAGKYKVTVRPPEGAAVKVGSDDYKSKMMPGGAKTEVPKSEIPAKFQTLADTKIELDIKPGANPNVDLDLSKL